MNEYKFDPKDFEKYTTQDVGKLELAKPSYSIQFHQDNKVVGGLDFNGPEMTFEGDMAESARLFLQFVAQSFKGRLDEEYQRGYNAAKKENA